MADKRSRCRLEMRLMGRSPRETVGAGALVLIFTQGGSPATQQAAPSAAPTVAKASSSDDSRSRRLEHDTRVDGIAFSPDGRLLAAATDDGTVTLWDVATGERLRPALQSVDRAKKGFWAVRGGRAEFGADGKTLAGFWGDDIVVWDVATRQQIGHLVASGYTGSVFKGPRPPPIVAYSSDGGTLLVETREGFVLWNTSTRALTGPPLEGLRWDRIGLSPTGHLLASIAGDEVKLFDISTGRRTRAPLVRGKDLVATFSSDGAILAVTDADGVTLWDVAKENVAGRLQAWARPATSVFSPDGRVLAFVADLQISLWDVARRKEIAPPLTGHQDQWIETVEFSPDGKMLASGGKDFSVRLWDVATGGAIGEPLTPSRHGVKHGGVHQLAFGADGRILAATIGGELFGKMRVKLWDVSHRPPEQLVEFKAWRFVRSPDGRFLVLPMNGGLTLVDIASREGVARPAVVPAADNDAIIFSRDGSRLAVFAQGTKRRAVVVWDVGRLVNAGP